MNRYKITGTVTVSCYTTVVAESEERAQEIALGRSGDVQLSGITSRYKSEDCWVIEEGDGEPEISQLVLDEEDVDEEESES